MFWICKARRHRGFNQRTQVTPDHRYIAAKLQLPTDGRVHPQLEQNKRDQRRIEVARPETAPPDGAYRIWREEIDGPDDGGKKQGSRDQRLDPYQLGPQHFLRQRMLELGRYRRPLLVSAAAP
jgi:hypothetical protein